MKSFFRILFCCVLLLLRMSHAEKFSEQKTITTQADSAKFVYAADIDGDLLLAISIILLPPLVLFNCNLTFDMMTLYLV